MGEHAGNCGYVQNGVPCDCGLWEQSATLFKHQERIRALEDDRARGTAALKAAFGDDLWQIGHPAYVVTHMREEYRKVEVLWKQAESRAERLRESGDKVIESKNDRIRELEARIAQLEAALDKYGRHLTREMGKDTPACAVYEMQKCNCGLDAALAPKEPT